MDDVAEETLYQDLQMFMIHLCVKFVCIITFKNKFGLCLKVLSTY